MPGSSPATLRRRFAERKLLVTSHKGPGSAHLVALRRRPEHEPLETTSVGGFRRRTERFLLVAGLGGVVAAFGRTRGGPGPARGGPRPARGGPAPARRGLGFVRGGPGRARGGRACSWRSMAVVVRMGC